MPRYPRVFLAAFPHHIVHRGHDRKPVFAEDADYRYYLANLLEQMEQRQVGLYAWCLMSNHVHLLLEPITDGSALSELMRVVAARQTRYVNRLECRSGTLWEGRFKCSLVDRVEYLWACCRYIELNPVRATMVSTPEDYAWSSFRTRCGLVEGESPVPPLLPLDIGSGEDAHGYAEFVRSATCSEVDETVRTALRRNQLTGSERFREEIARKLGRRMSARGPGRPRAGDDSGGK